MKINGVAKFSLFGVYPFAVRYVADVVCGVVDDIQEVAFEEMGCDNMDSPRVEDAYWDALYNAVQQDVNTILAAAPAA